MGMLDISIMKKYVQMANDSWQQGWHERNGGNPTYRDFSRELWKVMTECPVIFPGGLGVVPWMVPGGADIALATCKKMEEYDAAIWAHHGLFASGPDFDITFGLMHTIEKAAQIWILKKSTCLPELTTISDDDLRAIGRDFHVTIREDFLD